MKKHLLILTILVLTFKLGNSQTNIYHPMPDSNAVWVYGVYGNCPPLDLCSYIYYTVHGDTIIGSHSYKKIYGSSDDGLTYGFNSGIRQDTVAKKVYVNNSNTDVLLYDFSQHVGDTLHQSIGITGGGGPFPINSIDSVLISGKWRKRINPNLNASLIEGIGSTGGLFGPWNGWEGGNYALLCFSINGIAVYPDTTCNIFTGINSNTNLSKNDFQIYPNPFSSTATLKTDKFLKDVTFTVYNIFGQQVKQIKNISGQTITLHRDNLPSGLYFFHLTQDNKILTTEKLIITD